MMSALSDVLPEFFGLLAFGALVAFLSWLFNRSWPWTRPRGRRDGTGSLQALRSMRASGDPAISREPVPTSLTHTQWRDHSSAMAEAVEVRRRLDAERDLQMRMRGGYTGTRLPDPPYPAPKRVMPPNATVIDDTIAEWLKREGIA